MRLKSHALRQAVNTARMFKATMKAMSAIFRKKHLDMQFIKSKK